MAERLRVVRLKPDELFRVVCVSNRGAEDTGLAIGVEYTVRRVRECYATGERGYELDTLRGYWYDHRAFSRIPR